MVNVWKKLAAAEVVLVVFLSGLSQSSQWNQDHNNNIVSISCSLRIYYTTSHFNINKTWDDYGEFMAFFL
jgi:hypothetical protein